MRKIVYLLIVVILTCNIFAEPKEDSLYKELSKARSDTAKANIYNALSKEKRFSQPDSSILLAIKALEISGKANYKKGRAKAYNNSGVVYAWSKAEYDKAIRDFNKALNIWKEINNKEGISSVYGNIGIVYRLKDDYGKALEYLKKALEIEKEDNREKDMAVTYSHIGLIYRIIGNYTEAIENLHKSLELNQKIDSREGIAQNLNNIGIVYSYQDKYEKALNHFRKALKIKTELAKKHSLASTYGNIATIYINTGKYDKALKFVTKTLEIDEEAGNKRGIAFDYHTIGNIYYKMGDYENSLENLFESLKITEQIGAKNMSAANMYSISKVYHDQKKYQKAIEYGKKSLDISKQIGAVDRIVQASEILSNTCEAKGDYKTAFDYQSLHLSYKDSLQNEEKARKIAELETKYEVKQQKRENKLLKEKEELNQQIIARQNIYNIIITSLLALVIVLAIVIYRSYRNKKKDNQKLEEQNSIINKQKSELEDKNAELEKANRSKDLFLSIVSHDLLNPFGSYKNVTAMLAEHYDEFSEYEKKDFVNTLNESAENLFEFIKNLLLWSRTQRNLIENIPENLAIRELVNNTVNLLSETAKRKNIEIKNEIDEDITAIADMNMTSTVLRNLIANAVKFTPEGGAVTITSKNSDEEVEISVNDTGVGINQEKLDKIFQPKGSSSTAGTMNETGSGMGLILCREFVEMNHGRIYAKSQPNSGSSFCFTLPKKLK